VALEGGDTSHRRRRGRKYQVVLSKITVSRKPESVFKKMSTSQLGLQRSLPFLSAGMGILALSGGIYSVVDPPAFSDALGIPVRSSKSPALPFVSFVGARNLSSGTTVLALLYTGQRKALGMIFMCGVVTAVLDSWICFQHNATEGKAVGHAVMGVAAGLLGAGMYWG
jgi:hypothetical protein